MRRMVSDEIAEVVGVGQVVGRLRRADCAFQGDGKTGLRIVREIELLDRFSRGAPGLGLVMRDRVFEPEDKLLKVVLQLDIQAMRERSHAGVVAVVALHALGQALRAIAEEQVEALAHVRIGMPAVDHALVEAVYVPKRLARHELEISRLVEPHVREGERGFFQVQPAAEIFAGLHDGPRIATREGLPKRLGQFEARHDVQAVRKIADCAGEIAVARARQENHVRIGEQHPAIAWVGAANRDVARVRFERGEVRASHHARMQFRAHAEDPKPHLRGRSQGVVDRFDESGKIVGGVVVDEQDLVIGIAQNLRDAVEADGRAFV